MLLGISSFSYGWAVGVKEAKTAEAVKGWDAFTLLRQAQKLQVPLLQYGDNLPLGDRTDGELLRLSQQAEESGIVLEVGTRGFWRENLLRFIQVAKLLHSKLLRVVTDLEDIRPSPQEIVAGVRELLPLLEREQVVLAIENHDRFPSETIAWMVRQVNSPFFGVCLDMANSIGAGEGIRTVLEELAPYTVNLHVKDFKVRRLWHQMGFQIEGCPAGEGMLDIPHIIQDLKNRGRQFNAVLELWTPPEKSLNDTLQKEDEWVKRSLDYLRTQAESW